MEYILTQDEDCHWYIIPVDKQVDWNKFIETDSLIYDIPEYAKPVGGSPTLVKFEKWRIE